MAPRPAVGGVLEPRQLDPPEHADGPAGRHPPVLADRQRQRRPQIGLAQQPFGGPVDRAGLRHQQRAGEEHLRRHEVIPERRAPAPRWSPTCPARAPVARVGVDLGVERALQRHLAEQDEVFRERARPGSGSGRPRRPQRERPLGGRRPTSVVAGAERQPHEESGVPPLGLGRQIIQVSVGRGGRQVPARVSRGRGKGCARARASAVPAARRVGGGGTGAARGARASAARRPRSRPAGGSEQHRWRPAPESAPVAVPRTTGANRAACDTSCGLEQDRPPLCVAARLNADCLSARRPEVAASKLAQTCHLDVADPIGGRFWRFVAK